MKRKDIIAIVFLLAVIFLFFRAIFSFTKAPIPTDTLVNLFNPYRDFYAKSYPRGVPFKNPLVGDPVLQQIPGRELSIELIKELELPLWNPYQMAGYPLLGNIQSAPFYPLNFIFFLLPFLPAWTVLILSQQILAGIFMFLYLRNRKFSHDASIFGALVFSFCGFFVAWLEWGTIVSTALWIPLGLLAIDKLQENKKITWCFLLGFSIGCSLLAGHLQTFIYGISLLVMYSVFSWWQGKREGRFLVALLLTLIIALLITTPVWIPQLNFILLSARNVDMSWQKLGWFIPLAQLMQFFAPDFFGNPATGNYWGVFNYGEFIGYVGMAPLLLACLAVFSKRRNQAIFWGSLLLLSLVFATQNPIAELPYKLNIPFFSSTQPTRLLVLADIALAILAAMGLESFLESSRKKLFAKAFLTLSIIAIVAYGFVVMGAGSFAASDFAISKHNLIVPSGLFLLSAGVILIGLFVHEQKRRFFMLLLIGITTLDLLFFAGKYTPFASTSYFYPTTKSLAFLQHQPGQFRIMTTTRQILSPNIATIYHIQSIDGYDPLYMMRYGELMAASERDKPDISAPFGFNRIVVSNQTNSRIIDLLGVKYVLSLTERSDSKLKKVFQEGETRIYENSLAFPRVFFVSQVKFASSNQQAINMLFDPKVDLHDAAIVEDTKLDSKLFSPGSAQVVTYQANKVVIRTMSVGDAFLVLIDTFYPTWSVYIDNQQKKIMRTDYNFRGVVVPSGAHTVEFRDSLF